MSHNLRALWFALTAAALLVAVSTGAFAQTDTPKVRVAVVDARRVNDVYVQANTRTQDLEDWARQQQSYLDELKTKYMYLGEESFNEVLEYLRMPRPLPADPAKRQRELLQVNDKNEGRYVELQAKLDRTPQEQDEFNRLQSNLEAREKQIEGILKDLQTQLDERQRQNYESVMANVQKAVVDIAAAGGYQLVLNKLVVVYGGDDITDRVLEKLTGKPVSPAAETPAAPADAGGGG